jgi:hypothetical protein
VRQDRQPINARHIGAFRIVAAEQLGKQLGKWAPGPSYDPAERPGPRESPSEQLHTWLANARRGGAFSRKAYRAGRSINLREPSGRRPQSGCELP